MVKTLEELEIQLKERLIHPLPAYKAHLGMMPEVSIGILSRPYPEGSTPGSVMILFFEEEAKIKLVFIHRQQYKGVHSNQISFPGGKFENSDDNFYETALRETEEEVGISRNQIKLLGKLSPLYIPPSNFLVHPFVGISYEKLFFKPDRNEVKEILIIELKDFYDSSCRSISMFETVSSRFTKAPCFLIGDIKIWGATAMIINELLFILYEYQVS